MALFNIKIDKVSAESASADGLSDCTIVLQGKLHWRSSIQDKSGKDLSKAAWSIQIVRMDRIAKVAKEASVAGMCGFSARIDADDDSDEYFFGHVGMAQTELDALYMAWMSGKRFDYITLDVQDVEYNWEPDGSGKVWDTSTASRKVASARIGIVDEPAAEVIGDPFEDSSLLPPTRNDIATLSKTLASISTVAHYLLGAVVFGVAVLIFR
jgi:hypothetical protein